MVEKRVNRKKEKINLGYGIAIGIVIAGIILGISGIVFYFIMN
jgi:hypothetical protein